MTAAAATGHRVVVRALAADPLAALAAQQLVLEPMTPPDPATLGPRDVLVEVRSASVNWVDLIMATGQYQHLLEPPYTPGLEYAGVIAAVGPEVAAATAARPTGPIAPGDAVLVDGLLAGPRSLGAYQRWGGWASWAVAPADAVHRIPGGLSFDQAATLLGSYETAYHALVTRARVQPGETVLVLGASGATGLAAVHVARLLGATVIATGRSPAKLATVAAAGAHHTIVTPTLDDAGGRALRDQVKALTGGRGVDVVHDGVGGAASLAALRCTRFGARFVIVGWAATPGAVNTLPTNLIMMKGLDVLGSPAAISVAHDPTIRPPRFAQIWAWASAGVLVPHVSQVFPLTDFASAVRARWNGGIVGGAVLRNTP